MDTTKWLELDMETVRGIIYLFIVIALLCIAVIIYAITYYSDPDTLFQKTAPFIAMLFTSIFVILEEYHEYKKLKRKIEKTKRTR